MDEARANWKAVHAQAQSWWNGTSTREKIKQSSQLLTEWVLFDKCLGLFHTAGSIALAEVKTGRVAQSMSKFELAHTAPGFALLQECETTAELIKIACSHGLPAEKLEKSIFALEYELGGCRHNLKKMIRETSHIEGIDEVVRMVLQDKLPNITGALYELETISKILKSDAKVIGVSVKIKAPKIGWQEIDIITNTCFIECKNWKWATYIDDLDKTREKISYLKSLLGRKKIVAEQANKKLVLCSKHKLPLTKEFEQLRLWLVNNNIELIEG